MRIQCTHIGRAAGCSRAAEGWLIWREQVSPGKIITTRAAYCGEHAQEMTTRFRRERREAPQREVIVAEELEAAGAAVPPLIFNWEG